MKPADKELAESVLPAYSPGRLHSLWEKDRRPCPLRLKSARFLFLLLALAVPCTAARQLDAQSEPAVHRDSFQEGLIALKENRLQEALEKLTVAEREHSSDARIRNFRGIVLARLARTDEAADEYREAIRLDPQLEDAHRNLGFLEWTRHHPQDAASELRRALELAPDDAFARYYLGRVELDAKLYSEAFRDLERSGVAWPPDPEFLMQASTGLAALGRHEAAKKTAERLANIQLNDAQSVNAAVLLISVQSNASAIEVLRKLQQRQRPGSDVWAQFDLALAHLLAGNYPDAARQAETCLQNFKSSEPPAAQNWSVIGIAKAHLGEPDAAIAAFRKASSLEPGQEEHWLNLTRELMDLGRNADAISATRAGLAANPRSYALQLRLGAAYLAADRYAEAEQSFRELVRAGDPLPTSYVGLAQVLLRTGRAADAVAELDSARKKLGPNFLIAYFRGLAFTRTAQPQEAMSAFEEAVQLNPASAEAHLGVGKTALAMGRMQDAVRELEESLRLDPGNAQAQRLLAQARRRAGNTSAPAEVQDPLAEASDHTQGHLVDDFVPPQWEMPP